MRASRQTSPATADSINALRRECEQLNRQLDIRNDVILKLTFELDRTREDLEYAEKQFISLERGLQNNETKASAVASLAEAKLAYDAILRAKPDAQNRPDVQTAAAKIENSDQLLSERRYGASVYFSKRALNMLSDKHDERNIRIVSVKRANLRTGPGLEHQVLDRVALGTVLVELESASSWYKVRMVDGRAGWIHKSVTR